MLLGHLQDCIYFLTLPIVQMGKLSLRDTRELVPSHTAIKLLSKEINVVLSYPEETSVSIKCDLITKKKECLSLEVGFLFIILSKGSKFFQGM